MPLHRGIPPAHGASRLCSGLRTSEEEPSARSLAKLIREEGITVFSPRDTQRSNRADLGGKVEVKATIDVHVQSDWLAERKPDVGWKGGRAQVEYIVNPKIWVAS